MSSQTVFLDEYLKISIENNVVLAETFKRGFPLEQLSSFSLKHPEFLITDSIALRNAIQFAPSKAVKIGEIRERIHLEIPPSGLSATVTFNIPEAELAMDKRQELSKELDAVLKSKHVVYGINTGLLLQELSPGRTYTLAQGIPAFDGNDAIIRMYELMETRPEIREDGRADFYEVKLINRVKPGDWLGERIEATDGTPGKSVYGEIIKPLRGKTAVLNYDRNSVAEVSEQGKTTLYSRLNGAVNYTNGRIGVSNHLEVAEVGVATGNIKFDGYLTIKGTVRDGFSVETTRDIEINGEYGLGSVKSIVSTGGSIYIRGGIASNEKVEIHAAKNIYTKFADNSNITCGNTAHIGYYSLNSSITAREIVFDASNGQVIGGRLRADVHITVPLAGSEMERKTTIEITGFNRQSYIDRLDELFHYIGEKKLEQQKLKQQVAVQSAGSASQSITERLFLLKNEIKELEEERKIIAGYLKAHGDGEITVTRRVYPNCYLILKGMTAEIPSGTMAAAVCLKDGEIKFI